MYFLFILVDEPWLTVINDPRYKEAADQIILPSDEKEESKKYKKSGLTPEKSKEIVNKLNSEVKKRTLYLNPQLTLSDLAEAIDVSTNILSQALNENLGKNYYEYINEFRLEHFIKLFKHPNYNQFTMLSIAFESGFNSKSTFNAYFKTSKGMTPREYFKDM